MQLQTGPAMYNKILLVAHHHRQQTLLLPLRLQRARRLADASVFT